MIAVYSSNWLAMYRCPEDPSISTCVSISEYRCDAVVTRLLSGRTLLRCSYKCLGKLRAVITPEFMRWIAPAKFQVCRKQQYTSYPMFVRRRPNVTCEMERNPRWRIRVKLCYESLLDSLRLALLCVNGTVDVLLKVSVFCLFSGGLKA